MLTPRIVWPGRATKEMTTLTLQRGISAERYSQVYTGAVHAACMILRI
jgi:hypothetical protein